MKPTDVILLMGLKSNESRSLEEIKRIQEKKLMKLIRHAYDHVPFYRRIFDSRGLTPGDIRTAADLSKLPVSDKKTIQQLPLSEICADNVDLDNCRPFMTSGTSGHPLKFYITRQDLTMKNLICARTHTASGLRPWHKISVLGGDRLVNEKKSWYEYLGLWRRREISSWKTPHEWATILTRWKPDILVGRVTTLKLLAEAVTENSQFSISPKLVFSSAGMLDEQSRQYLKSAFHCPVTDFYTSFEGGCLAWECSECKGYHINIDSVVMEVIKDGRPAVPGEEGEVVITNLHLKAMPFIRYRQDDMVVLSNRAPVCGINLPLIERINGRKDDYLVMKSGRKIPPQPVYHVVIPVRGIKRWRVIQSSTEEMTVEVEPVSSFSDEQQMVLIREMDKLTRGEIKTLVRVVERIPVDPAKKFRVINSTISKEKGNPS